MNVSLGDTGANIHRAAALLKRAAKSGADVLVLPETWNTGFFPREGLRELSDGGRKAAEQTAGFIAREYGVNVVAGSVADLRDGKVFNTCRVFDRSGKCIAEYDKTHLFSPMEEDRYFTAGDRLCTFRLDGVRCGVIICYDLRFPELARSLALRGMDVLFVVSEWPLARISHLKTLLCARAVENSCFAVCCNACGKAGGVVFGGSSLICDPNGSILASCGTEEDILCASFDTAAALAAREKIPVFADRRADIYKL